MSDLFNPELYVSAGSSDEDTLLANISASVMMMAPASPLDMYVNLSLLYRQILILSINEDEAAALGVNVTVLRFIILMIATLIVSSIICVTGLISFIGLIAPHIARLLTRRNDRFTYISSGLAGCLYNKVMIIKPAHVTKKGIARLSFETPLRLPMIQYSIEASCLYHQLYV